MRGCIPTGIEGLATRGPPPRGIEGRDYMLPRTSSLRSRVREEPSEAPAISLCGRRHYQSKSQPKDAKSWTHRPLRHPYKLYGANGRVTGTSLTTAVQNDGPLGTMARRHKTD